MYCILLKLNYLLNKEGNISEENIKSIKLANEKNVIFVLIIDKNINSNILDISKQINAKFILSIENLEIYDVEKQQILSKIKNKNINYFLDLLQKESIFQNNKLIYMSLGFDESDLDILQNVSFPYLIANHYIKIKNKIFLNTCALDQDGLSYAIKDFLYRNNLI